MIWKIAKKEFCNELGDIQARCWNRALYYSNSNIYTCSCLRLSAKIVRGVSMPICKLTQ